MLKKATKKKKHMKPNLPGNKKSKWAAQSSQLRNAMRAARGLAPKTQTYGGGMTVDASEA